MTDMKHAREAARAKFQPETKRMAMAHDFPTKDVALMVDWAGECFDVGILTLAAKMAEAGLKVVGREQEPQGQKGLLATGPASAVDVDICRDVWATMHNAATCELQTVLAAATQQEGR